MARETFNRIKKVYAAGGHVIIEVYDREPDKDTPLDSVPISSKVLDVKAAAARARALNAMALKLPEKDGKVALDIVADTIAACKEAQEQLFVPPSKQIVV